MDFNISKAQEKADAKEAKKDEKKISQKCVKAATKTAEMLRFVPARGSQPSNAVNKVAVDQINKAKSDKLNPKQTPQTPKKKDDTDPVSKIPIMLQLLDVQVPVYFFSFVTSRLYSFLDVTMFNRCTTP